MNIQVSVGWYRRVKAVNEEDIQKKVIRNSMA